MPQYKEIGGLRENPAGTFFKFVLGFFAFISLSFLITFAVNSYTIAKEKTDATAAAFQAMLEQK